MPSIRERIGKLRSSKKDKKRKKKRSEEKSSSGSKTRQRKSTSEKKSESVYKVKRRGASFDAKRFEKMKDSTHRQLLEEVDLSLMKDMNDDEVEAHIRKTVQQILERKQAILSQTERKQLVKEIIDEVVGFGPLEPLLDDPSVSDILVNGAKQIYVEREGKLQLTDVKFKDDKHLSKIIDRIVSMVGRHIDEASPMCDARLPDGSRVNAIIPPLAIDYPSMSIRKFKTDALSMSDLINYGTITEQMAAVFEAAVKCRLNILISGGTGSGKTTLLNILSGFIPHNQRIVTIEDSAELQLQQPHVVRLETRPPNIEGKGEVTQYDLVRNSLRMRPDRVILGEVRGREALDMLQAMNTGHDGSMCTIHANTPRDALVRLETMIAMGGMELPQSATRQQTSSAIDVIVQAQRMPDGTRKLTHFSEVLGMEGDIISMQDIFLLDRHGIDEEGNVIAEHKATGVQPRFVERMKAAGINLPPGVFMPD